MDKTTKNFAMLFFQIVGCVTLFVVGIFEYHFDKFYPDLGMRDGVETSNWSFIESLGKTASPKILGYIFIALVVFTLFYAIMNIVQKDNGLSKNKYSKFIPTVQFAVFIIYGVIIGTYSYENPYQGKLFGFSIEIIEESNISPLIPFYFVSAVFLIVAILPFLNKKKKAEEANTTNEIANGITEETEKAETVDEDTKSDNENTETAKEYQCVVSDDMKEQGGL